MKERLFCEFKVRSYELDAYGHVNHAVFLNYYEQARLEFLEQKGLSFHTLWEEGYIFVIVRAEIDYFKPLAISEQIIIGGELESIGTTSLTLHQEIVRSFDQDVVSRAKFVAVFLDRSTQKPAPVPESFLRAFSVSLQDKLSE
ncbi:MAG: thioesterase family protein [bacterium]